MERIPPANVPKTALTAVAVLCIGFVIVESAVAWAANSVALFADAADFTEDAALSLIAILSFHRAKSFKRRTAFLAAAIIALPGVVALALAIGKVAVPSIPNAEALTLTSVAAFVVNAANALILVRAAPAGGTLVRAAYLSSRNDLFANAGMIAAGLFTAAHPSPWPDAIVGLAVFALNADAALEVYRAARAITATAS